MRNIDTLVNEIYNNSQIPFQLNIEGIGKYTTPKFKNANSTVEKAIKYKGVDYKVMVNNQHNLAIDLLMFCLQSALKSIIIEKENLISMLLDDNEVEKSIILDIWPRLNGTFQLMNIFVEGDTNNILACIKKIYINTEVEVVLYNGNIIVIGDLQETINHAKKIKEIINTQFNKKCYISYCEVSNYKKIRQAYIENLKKIQIAIKYKVNCEIFDDNELILEVIVDSISDEMKLRMYDKFASKISNLDGEMIRTIETYFKCGLNTSEAAKELFIHRNTLLYRLDKIQKITSYDIREFNNAMLMRIMFFYLGIKKQF
ncbi:MAG: PucR family transcriptional regulator [Clostridium saudiense]|uniref:PucR family transcriptional regulator n=1 Tax=Clostridium saudiense TaxID=1414720 RepID=UPI0018AB078E|nr:helix-turn-helix domain-containing protein [Clostridium saudiense]